MNSKNITRALKAKLDNWFSNIDDEKLVKEMKKNVIITGGAFVSMLNGEKPNDYDVYFKTFECCRDVAQYYANIWNKNHPNGRMVLIKDDFEKQKVTAFIRSSGIVEEQEESKIDDESEPEEAFTEDDEEKTDKKKGKYYPRYITSNAITLSDKIQIVLRFFGPVEDIHKNYDFVHCTCSYDYDLNKTILPARALEAIINKELYYVGSKYPLCSIIRTRKFISRGWTINAGQYVKMALQLNELNLRDVEVFKDQLTGVDSAYFEMLIGIVEKQKEENPDFIPDNTYLFDLINKIF